MSPVSRILLGLLVAAVGVFAVYKTDVMLSWVGRSFWAEKTFGGGGSRFMYKAAGILIAIFGIIIMTNTFELLFGSWLLKAFGAGRV